MGPYEGSTGEEGHERAHALHRKFLSAYEYIECEVLYALTYVNVTMAL